MIIQFEPGQMMMFTPPIGPGFAADIEGIAAFHNFWMKNELTCRFEFYQAQLEMAKLAGDVEGVEKLLPRIRDLNTDIFRLVVKWLTENRTRMMPGKLLNPGQMGGKQ